MDESKKRAALRVKIASLEVDIAAANKRHEAATNTMFEMKGRLGFHDRLNALSAAKDEVDELIKCIESYERQEAEYLFSDNATVPKLLEQVKQLRDELTAIDELRVRKAREHATDFAISTFWKMMHRIGGMPVPSPPLWTIDDGCSQRAQAVLRDLPSPPIAETPKVHAALDVVEKWCREVQRLTAATPNLDALKNWIPSNLKKGELKACEFILTNGGTASLKNIALHLEWTKPYNNSAGGLCRRVSIKLKKARLGYKLHRHDNSLKFSTVESMSKRNRAMNSGNKTL